MIDIKVFRTLRFFRAKCSILRYLQITNYTGFVLKKKKKRPHRFNLYLEYLKEAALCPCIKLPKRGRRFLLHSILHHYRSRSLARIRGRKHARQLYKQTLKRIRRIGQPYYYRCLTFFKK